MNEAISPYVLTNENSPAFWLNDNLWMPLAGSCLTNGNFCFIEQVCGIGIGGPPTHSHPSDEGLYIIPPPDLESPGTPEQMQALFQRVGMITVALPDALREH